MVYTNQLLNLFHSYIEVCNVHSQIALKIFSNLAPYFVMYVLP
jgi:hypothetical protein